MKLNLRTVRRTLRGGGHRAAHGTVSERELVLVSLQAGDGLTGHGEAAPLPSYDGVGVGDVVSALEDCRPVLEQYPGHAPIADVIARCGERTIVAQALAAIDLALWDLAGQRVSEPVWRLLGAADGRPVPVNATIDAPDRSGAASEAAEARAAGFRTVKVKVGIGDDAGRLAAVRAFAGPQMAIRIDANGAWTVEQAAATLDALEPVGIELCEEPVHGLAEIASLRGRGIPLALDETAGDPLAFSPPASAELACLKLSRCGGISGLIAAAADARAAGYEVFLASALDGPLGIAAALHAAAALRPQRACGLATLGLFDGAVDPLPARDGMVALPAGPGLGAGLVDWY
ncbi:MAG TPA: enolase C-terminal domain-like protein [Solirubrobacteraceae bacterium]|nr:enolase C-terminal domain-like protein [Solirubrobacteraceae bacterium]